MKSAFKRSAAIFLSSAALLSGMRGAHAEDAQTEAGLPFLVATIHSSACLIGTGGMAISLSAQVQTQIARTEDDKTKGLITEAVFDDLTDALQKDIFTAAAKARVSDSLRAKTLAADLSGKTPLTDFLQMSMVETMSAIIQKRGLDSASIQIEIAPPVMNTDPKIEALCRKREQEKQTKPQP